MNKDVVRRIYDAMSEKYDMAEDFNTFAQDIQDKNVARRVYDAMYESYKMEEDFTTFYNDLMSAPQNINSDSEIVDESPKNRRISMADTLNASVPGMVSSGYTEEVKEEQEKNMLTQEEKDQRAAMRQRLQEDGTIDRMKESKKEARREKLRAFGSMLGSTPQVTSFGVSTNVFDSTDEQLADVGKALDAGTEYRQNKLLQEKLDVALDMARAGENQDGMRGVENFGLGLWDSATRLSTWDFGASDIVNNLTLQQIVEKWKNDPSSLTATEQKVLEGIGMATAVQELYSDQVGIGYNVGQSLPESAGFMASMALNPASGLGKSLARNAVRTYGRNSIRKNLYRLGGDFAETAIMTATTGAGRVAADALERINGSSTYEIGDNGVIMYGGQKDQETVGNAVIKAIGANFIENYSEALGEYFDPLLGMSRKVAAGGLRKMNLNKWADALSDVQPSQMTASIRSLREKTKFGGIFGEIMEEEIGMALNTLFVGDNQWSDFVDLENQLTTVLSCAIMSGTLNGVEQVSSVAARRRMEKNAKNAEQEASYRFHRDEFAPLREAIDQASPEGMVDVLRDVYMSQEYTVGQKRALAEYAAARLQLQYYNAADAKARRQVNKTQQELLDAQEAGLNAQLPQFFNIARAAQYAEDELLDYDGDFNLVDIIRSSMNKPEEMERILGDLPPREAQLVTNYIYSRARMDGAYQGRSNRAEDYIDDFAYSLEPAVVTDTEGNRTITTALLGDRSVYVLENNGDLAHIMRPDGSKILVKASELTNITTSSAEEVIDRYRDMYTFEYNAETENAFEHHPKTQAPQVGLQLQSPEGEVVITAVNDNMVEIVPAVYKDGQVQPKEGAEPRTITVDDAYAWQDDYYLSMDADQAYANAMAEASNMSAETAENPSFEQGDDLNFYVGGGAPISAEITGITPEGKYLVQIDHLVYGLNKSVVDEYTADELRELSAPSSNMSANQAENEGTPSEQIEQSVSEKVTNGQIEENASEPTAEVVESVNTPQAKAAELLAELESDEVDENIVYNTQKAIDLAEEKRKAKPTMKDADGDVATFKALKAQWQAELEDAQRNVLFWNNVAKEVANARVASQTVVPEVEAEAEQPAVVQPMDMNPQPAKKAKKSRKREPVSFDGLSPESMTIANGIMADMAPQNGVELAAAMMSTGGKRIIPESFRKHTGYSTTEQKSFLGLIAGADKGGLTIEHLGELVMQADREDGTNFFDQNDANAGLNAVLEVLGQAETIGDVNDYIKRNREEAAYREAWANENAMLKAEQEAKDAWYMEQYHATEEELAAYSEYLAEITEEIIADDTNYEERFNTFAELIVDEYDNQGTDADIRSSADQGEGLASDREGGSSVGEGEETDRQGAVLGDAPRFAEAEDGRAGSSVSAQSDAERIGAIKAELGVFGADNAAEYANRLYDIYQWKSLEEANEVLKAVLRSYDRLSGQTLGVLPYLDQAQKLIKGSPSEEEVKENMRRTLLDIGYTEEEIAAAERDQQRYEADMAEDAAETVETLENGDVRRTNRNSNGEIATVVIERDGDVISVDTYEDGALFERTDYDANGNATKVTRYKDGEVVSEQEYKDGKRKVTANVFEMAEEAQKKRKTKEKSTLKTKYYGQEDSDVLVGDNSEGRAGRLGGPKAGNAGVRQEGRESTSNDNKRNRGDSESSKTRAQEGTVATSSDNRRVVDESAIEETPIKELRNRIRNLQALIIGIDNTERIRGIDEEIANKRERYKAELTYAKDVLAKKEGNKWGVEDMQPVSLETAEAMFNEWNDDADVKALFDRVFDVFKKFGIDIKLDDAYKHDNKKAFFDAADNHIVLPMHITYEEYIPQQEKATILLHEMIHGVTQYVLHAVEMTPESRREKGINISKGMLEAANQLHSIYNYISVGGVYKDVNGMQDVHEMVSQLADPNFRAFLKEQSLWDKIVEAIQKLLGIPVENNALDTSAKLLDYILDNYDIEAYNKLAGRINRAYYSQSFDDNLRFRDKGEPKDGKSLVGLHNISEDKLKKAIKMGGLANPSMAVIDIDKQDHTGYGSITLVAPSSLIDKKTGKNVGTYTADAWTPIYPNVVKQMSKEKAYNESIDSIPSELRSKVRLYFNAYLEDGNIGGAMYYWFLHDTGRNPEMVQSKSEVYSEDELNAFEAISRDYSFYRLSEEDKQKVLDLYVKSIGGQEEFDKKIARRIEHMQKQLLREDLKPMLRQKVERKLQEIQERGYDYDAVSEYYDAAQRVLNTRGKLDEFATFRNAEDVVRNEGLQKDFEDWLAEKEEQFGVKEYIFTGYTNSGDRKYVPNTLANASKEMKKSGRAGATGLAGFNHYISTLAQNVGSLNQIRKKKSNLSSEEEYNAFRDKWGEVYIELAQALQPDADGWADYGFYRLEEMSTVKNPKEHVKKEYGIDLSDDFMQKYNSLVAAIKNEFPARYFETKFERPVYLSEFAAAVVPTGTSKEVVDALKQSGLEVVEYEQGNEEARTEAVRNITNEIENIRFREGAPFFSNAERAIENIKQQKATPEQWFAMIKKEGGLKAGEDKWMGLSDWLNEQKEKGVKTLTKDEVLQFIRENQIEIEEVEYGDIENNSRFKELNDEYRELYYEYDYNDDAAFEEMVSRYGDDFELAFSHSGDELVVEDTFGSEAAEYFLGVRSIDATRRGYTTDGLDNKQEIALVVPTIDSWNRSDIIHFGDAGEGRAVAWVRFGETTGTDGNRVLVIDEVQSKRHDEGRANGYKSNARLKELEREYDALIDEQVELTKEILHDAGYAHKSESEGVYNETMQLKAETGLIGTDEQRARYNDLSNKLYEVSSEQRKLRNSIPDAPFDKNYHELVMKRMLRYAAENGFDKVAWNTGKQVAKRFGLSSKVSSIEYKPLANGHYNVTAYGTNGYPIEGVPVVYNNEQEIAETFGRGIAEKIVNDIEESKKTLKETNDALRELKERRKGLDEDSEEYEEIMEEYARLFALQDEANSAKSIEGEDLSIGGEDRVALYDEMIPRFMNKYTKKWGTKVGEVTLPNVEEAGRTMWSVDVTPEMRESVMQGQPMFREGMGAISDREVSYENDPIAKFQGKPRYYGKKAAAFAERERRRMENAAKEAAEMLGIEAEIITDASTLQGRKAKAKGWYDIVNKKVVVVVPNHVSMGDAVRTVLHEGIAHHGLRELFGDGFDAMLDNVYNNVAPELKARIDAIAERTGVSTSVATEEYMASLAETTNFEEAQRRGWWQKIKSYFVDMLRKLSMPGLKLKEEITDNELRYLLWRSYKNLVEPNSYLKPLGYAEDVMKQKELKVGEYAEKKQAAPIAADIDAIEEIDAIESEGAVRFRLVDDPEVIAELEASPKRTGYRNVVLNEDGTFSSPMAYWLQSINGGAKTRVEMDKFELGQWEEAQENIDLVDEDGHIALVKPDKSTVKVAYDPYIHNRLEPVNLQFKDAWKRDDLVYVETEVAETDLNSGYHAEKAKLPVGVHSWSNGDVMLSKYDKPVRIMPWNEVADVWAERLNGEGVNFDRVPAAMRELIVERGVEILPPTKGMGKDCNDAYKKWREENPKKKGGLRYKAEVSLESQPMLRTAEVVDEGPFSTEEKINAIIEESANLGVKVRVANDASELHPKVQEDIAKGKPVKGYYDTRAGEVVIYALHATSTNDVKRTILHEVVGHKGIRKLLGEDNFNQMMAQMYQMLPEDVRQSLNTRIMRNSWSIPVAMDEYLSEKAELDVQPTWWGRINAVLRAVLRKVGFDVKLNDADVTYLLWRSRKRLMGDTAYDMAIDAIKKNAAKKEASNAEEREDEYIREREAQSQERAISDAISNYYEKYTATTNADNVMGGLAYALSNIGDGGFRAFANDLSEAWFEDIRSIRRFEEAVEKAEGKKLKSWEMVHKTANASSSVSAREMEVANSKYFQPLAELVGEMLREEIDGRKMEMNDIEIYLISKHAKENNLFLQKRAYSTAKRKKIAEKAKELMKGNMTEEQALEQAKNEVAMHLNDFRDDYSGLTELYENKVKQKKYEELVKSGMNEQDAKEKVEREGVSIDELEAAADEYIAKFEGTIAGLVGKLWKIINGINKDTITKAFEKGIISRSLYNDLMKRHKYYVPLQGWTSNYVGDIYSYVTNGFDTKPLQTVIKKAEGTKHQARSIIGTMFAMNTAAIIQGNENITKQKLYNLAMNHDTGVLQVMNLWEVKDGEEWVAAETPIITEGMSNKDVQKVLTDYEKKMRDLEKDENARRTMNSLSDNFGKNATEGQKKQHHIELLINGQKAVLWINGNPKLAEAINGQLKVSHEFGMKMWGNIIAKANQLLARTQTSLNPEFLVGNFERDILTASMSNLIQHGFGYQKQYMKNLAQLMPITAATNKAMRQNILDGVFGIWHLFKLDRNTNNPNRRANAEVLDMNNPMHREFVNFLNYGGKTGYIELRKADDIQTRFARLSKREQSLLRKLPADSVEWALDTIERMNEAVENAVRFAAYLTARENGKSITEAIYEAKEVSVNFNMHGSGAWGNAWFRAYYNYINVALQALRKEKVKFQNAPKASLATWGILIGLGVMRAMLGYGDDDDEEMEYGAMSEWSRYNYVNVRLHKDDNKFVRYALPQEIRGFYAIGQISYEWANGWITSEQAMHSYATQLNNFTPLGFVPSVLDRDPDSRIASGIIGALVPSVGQTIYETEVTNEDFLGRPIHNQNEYNKYEPEWQRAGYRTPEAYIKFSKALSEATGGSEHQRGGIEINPSKLYHHVSGFGGGTASFLEKCGNLVELVLGKEEAEENELRDYPFVSKVLVETDTEFASQRSTKTRYDMYRVQYEELDKAFKGYAKDLKYGKINKEQYDKEVERLKNDNNYWIYQVYAPHEKEYNSLLRSRSEANKKGETESAKKYSEIIFMMQEAIVDEIVSDINEKTKRKLK